MREEALQAKKEKKEQDELDREARVTRRKREEAAFKERDRANKAEEYVWREGKVLQHGCLAR